MTAIELLLVIGIIAALATAVSLPLATMQTSAGISSAVDMTVDELRRAQLQAASGYYGSPWGVHFSDAVGCALPASTFQIYSGASFASATDTALVSLSGSAKITALNLQGGGCDVSFARFKGTTSASGTVTISNPNGLSKTVSISSYGRISRQ